MIDKIYRGGYNDYCDKIIKERHEHAAWLGRVVRRGHTYGRVTFSIGRRGKFR